MSQNATSNGFIQVADIRWPTGFGSMPPDDGSLLEPSKCALSMPTSDLPAGQGMDLRIDVANNFGEVLVETAYLVLTVTKANATDVILKMEIEVPANKTGIIVPLVMPSATGAHEVSIVDKRFGRHIQRSPITVIIGGACKLRPDSADNVVRIVRREPLSRAFLAAYVLLIRANLPKGSTVVNRT